MVAAELLMPDSGVDETRLVHDNGSRTCNALASQAPLGLGAENGQRGASAGCKRLERRLAAMVEVTCTRHNYAARSPRSTVSPARRLARPLPHMPARPLARSNPAHPDRSLRVFPESSRLKRWKRPRRLRAGCGLRAMANRAKDERLRTRRPHACPAHLAARSRIRPPARPPVRYAATPLIRLRCSI